MSGLGFGASGPWAARWFSEERAYDVLREGFEAGIRYVDTGPSYAGGHAEPRLGRLLARLAETEGAKPSVSSKVGTQLGKGGRLVKSFEIDDIDRQLATTLRSLGRRDLDVLYLHGPDEHELASALPFLTKQKESGRIKAAGVVADRRFVRIAARADGVDWIMAPYNVIDQTNGPALLKAKKRGKKICVVAPLAQALWRRDALRPASLASGWYAARTLLRNRDGLRRARAERWLTEVPGWSPAELCLAFVREALAPDLIMTTTTNPSHVRETAGALRRPVPDDLRRRLHGLIVS